MTGAQTKAPAHPSGRRGACLRPDCFDSRFDQKTPALTPREQSANNRSGRPKRDLADRRSVTQASQNWTILRTARREASAVLARSRPLRGGPWPSASCQPRRRLRARAAYSSPPRDVRTGAMLRGLRRRSVLELPSICAIANVAWDSEISSTSRRRSWRHVAGTKLEVVIAISQ
jgi:hypothetical protein